MKIKIAKLYYDDIREEAGIDFDKDFENSAYFKGVILKDIYGDILAIADRLYHETMIFTLYEDLKSKE